MGLKVPDQIEQVPKERKEEKALRITVFYKIIDVVVSGHTERFISATKIKNIFDTLR